ncbi:zinc finger MYM-type protein 1-like [Myzus persicae]|uniref:zinc finger MYM-type protein 1-like n=1 Tax=Myzus persicae TaxID=13164 RepID=UPI000B932D74|nr:zinc finger MYM-type protein 1-like [Myzus persicae]
MERFLITPGNLKSTAVSTVSEPNDPESSARTPISDTNKQLNLNIFDISVTCEDTAVQPVISFPRTFISGKQRSFQSSWYNKYPWLEYSIKMNAVFCYYCRHFPSHSQIEKDVLITGGYCDWKNISNMTKKHDKTTSHKNAIAKYGAWLSTKKTGSVSTQINKQVKEQVIKNRAILTSVIRCVLYCARQDIGLREHRRERNEEFNSENYDASLCSRHDVNEVNEVHIGSQIFSLIVDEARDQSKIEQMSICIRYLHNLKIKERFLGFVELNDLNAQALCDGIIFFLNNVGLDVSNCVSQSYDGASVMSGAFSSVQTKIRELAQNPCPYIHCHAHRLNLVLVDVTKNIQEVDEILGLLEAIYAFQSVSTIRHHAFLHETKYKVPQHCETRWVSKHKGITFFKNHFIDILKVLNAFRESTKKQEAAEAKGLAIQFAKFEQQILDLRNDEKFFELYEQSLVIAQNSKIPTPSSDNLSSKRTQQNSSTLADYYVTITTGKRKRMAYSSDDMKTEQKRIFFNILDVIYFEMNRRFNTKDDMYATLEALDQNSSTFLDSEIICRYAETFPFYRSNEFITKLKCQCQLGKTLFLSVSDIFELYQEVKKYKVGFEELTKIIENVLVVPVSSASAERNFSTMKRVKTYLKSTMTSSRLNNLTLLSIEREISGKFIENPSALITTETVAAKCPGPRNTVGYVILHGQYSVSIGLDDGHDAFTYVMHRIVFKHVDVFFMYFVSDNTNMCKLWYGVKKGETACQCQKDISGNRSVTAIPTNNMCSDYVKQ